MADFNWQMEDENDWSDEPGGEKPKKRPSFFLPLLILLTLSLAGFGVYSLINRQIEGAGEEIKADVLRTHELVMDAADAGDVELFTTFVSGASALWLEQQMETVEQGGFDEAPILGFELDDRPLEINDVTLNPSLDEATVTYTRWYTNPDQEGEFIALEQIAVYRRGEDRWLLAPPTNDFWGRETTIRKDKMTVVYRQRDEIQAIKLADDLAAAMPEICAELPSRECPDNWRLLIELSTDPTTTLYQIHIKGDIDDLFLSLPSPTILGIPVDQLAYQAVLHSYQELLNRRVTGVFTRYLSENPALIPPVAQIRTPEGDLLESLPPHLLPDKDLLLSCSTTIDGKQGWGVFQYSLSTGDWDQVFQREYESGDSGFIFPLPEGKGYAIQEYLRGEPLTARMLLWQDGETIVVGEQTVNFDNALFAPYYLRDMDPSGRYLLIGVTNETGEGWFLLDREMCDEESGCVLQAIINRPIWSPDGRQTLMQEQQPSGDSTVYRTLYLADEFGQNPIEIGTGTSPFWLNENTYGYSRLNEDSQMELILSDGENSWVALNESELISLVPEERNWMGMTIWNSWPSPRGNMFILETSPNLRQNSGPFDFFLVTIKSDGLDKEWLTSDDFPASALAPFSPDGRYISINQRGTPFYFYDLETDTSVPFDGNSGWLIDWSPNGSFYIQWADEVITLTNPASGLQVTLSYDFSTCLGLEWITS